MLRACAEECARHAASGLLRVAADCGARVLDAAEEADAKQLIIDADAALSASIAAAIRARSWATAAEASLQQVRLHGDREPAAAVAALALRQSCHAVLSAETLVNAIAPPTHLATLLHRQQVRLASN